MEKNKSNSKSTLSSANDDDLWRIIPKSDSTRNVGVIASGTVVGFRGYQIRQANPPSLINWYLLLKNPLQSEYAVVSEYESSGNKRYHWYYSSSQSKVLCIESTQTNAQILQDDDNIFQVLGGLTTHTFHPKNDEDQYVKYISFTSLHMDLVNAPDPNDATDFDIVKVNPSPKPKPKPNFTLISISCVVAVLAGIAIYFYYRQ